MPFANILSFFFFCSVFKFNTLVSGRMVSWSRPSGYSDHRLNLFMCECVCFCLSQNKCVLEWFKMCISTDRWSSGLLNYILIQFLLCTQHNRSLQWKCNCVAFLITTPYIPLLCALAISEMKFNFVFVFVVIPTVFRGKWVQ